MLTVKAVRQRNDASSELPHLLDQFRRIVNVCVSTGIEQNVSSLKTLSSGCYHRLSREILGYYRLCAIITATGILHNYRKAKRNNPHTAVPHARRLMLTTCYGFKIQDGVLRLPVKPRTYVYIPLNSHTRRSLSGVTVRSVTVTPHTVSISYSKEVVEYKPEGYLGVDRNLDNVTVASTEGKARRFDLSEATRIKSTYRLVTSRFHRNDARIEHVVYAKYGLRQRNRVQAKTRRYGIVMERLTGIRRLYRKGNGQTRKYRARMNSWSFGELQRQIEYKARWEGVKVTYVPARNTSKRCSVCGYKTLENTMRQVWCPGCGTMLDRDVNAAVNIATGGVRFTPYGPPVKAMVEEREPNRAALIPKVDGDKLSHLRMANQY